ncbi:hypothetical protein C8F04DRAFT_1079113 [Mycena alexandri]|uniref:Ricin B lectin domain-containing protein n=1 Tax=Mycena alexandri TaxID=1745969 RepID=A0AAD6T818_9AGAR|nr:hypothetical protein C8F04DRAFT_1079113 [Mycena alexandri]
MGSHSLGLSPLRPIMLIQSLSIVLLFASTFATSPVSDSGVSTLTRDRLVQNTHECTGYCNGPTCGETCSCSRMNFCFKAPSGGDNLYRIYNQLAGEATADTNKNAVVLFNGTQDEPAAEWKLESISGDTYHIVCKLTGTSIAYDYEHPLAPLIISTNKTFPVYLLEWAINPVRGSKGLFTVRLVSYESGQTDLHWTAKGSAIQLQAKDGSNAQNWRISPLP